MSIHLTSPAGIPNGLQRTTGTFPTTAGSFTAMGWVRNLNTAAPANDKLIFDLTDDVNLFNHYFYLAIGGGGTFLYGFYHNGTDPDINTVGAISFPLNEWHHWALTYDSVSHDISVYVDGWTMDTSNMSFAAAGPWAGEFTGTDYVASFGPGPYKNDHDVAAYRLWNQKLTIAQIQGEMVSRNALLRTNLVRDTPLAAIENLDDRSGNGNAWNITINTPTTDVSPYVGPGIQKTDTAFVTATGGAGTLTINKPANVVDGDIMIMTLSHNSGTYSSMPAGWGLVGHGLSNAWRGEMHWKRANGEGASYTVTNVGTVNRATLDAYHGVYKGGAGLISPVVVSSVTTGLTGTKPTYTGFSLDAPNCLLYGGVASSASESLSPGPSNSSSISPELIDPASKQLIIFNGGFTPYAATHEGTRLASGVVQDYVGTSNSSGDWVAILAAVLPAEGPVVTQSKYYLGTKMPNKLLLGSPQGTWDHSTGPITQNEGLDYCWEMSANATGHGPWQNMFVFHNMDTQSDEMVWRGVTPRLAAQTISGNVDVKFSVGSTKTTNAPAETVVYKMHAYVTQGNSLTPRSTLLNNYVDGNTWGAGGTKNFSAPQALTSQSCLSGDRVVIELGCRSTQGAFPAPTRPPVEFITNNIELKTSNGSNFQTGVAFGDLPAPVRTGFITISNPLIELDPEFPAVTNFTSGTATTITTLPYASGSIKTTETPSMGRRHWWTWVADRSAVVHFIAWGSNYAQQVWVKDSPSATGYTADKFASGTHHIVGSFGFASINSVAGKTYYIYTESIGSNNYSAPDTGGELFLQAFEMIPLANNDVILVSQDVIARYTQDGVLADFNGGTFSGLAMIGLAIDYSKLPFHNVNDSTTHTDFRLLAVDFANRILNMLDLRTLNKGQQPLDIMTDIGAIPAVLKDGSTLDCDLKGNIFWGMFGNGFTAIRSGNWNTIPTSRNAFMNATPNGGTGSMLLTSINHFDNQPGNPFPDDPTTVPTFDTGGVTGVAISPDLKYIYYTSDGTYLGSGGAHIYRYTIADGTHALWSTVTTSGHGTNPGLKGLFALRNNSVASGGVLVCNGNKITQLDSAGNLVKEFDPGAGENSNSLIGVEVTDDGKTMWCHDLMSVTMYKFDIASGALLLTVPTYLGTGTTLDMVIFRESTAQEQATQAIIKKWFLQRFDIRLRGEEQA